MKVTKSPKKDQQIKPIEGESVDSTVPEYSTHAGQLKQSQPTSDRLDCLEKALSKAYSGVIEYRQVAYICFGDLTAKELAQAFSDYPLVIKATLSCVNVAQRAIARDLGFSFDTYGSKISAENSLLLAGYIKPLLPPSIALPALMELDRYAWVDKELRANKGNWEKRILTALCKYSELKFIKRKFDVLGGGSKTESFELDAAYIVGSDIKVAVDIKRIESPRDIHKRADEIVNKARKYKSVYPAGRFVAIVYYPFPTQHINVLSRLQSPDVDDIFFAGESDSSIETAVALIAGKLEKKK